MGWTLFLGGRRLPARYLSQLLELSRTWQGSYSKVRHPIETRKYRPTGTGGSFFLFRQSEPLNCYSYLVLSIRCIAGSRSFLLFAHRPADAAPRISSPKRPEAWNVVLYRAAALCRSFAPRTSIVPSRSRVQGIFAFLPTTRFFGEALPLSAVQVPALPPTVTDRQASTESRAPSSSTRRYGWTGPYGGPLRRGLLLGHRLSVVCGVGRLEEKGPF